MNNPIFIIISREYFERVRRRGFIITTLLMPLLMVGLMVLPAIISSVSSPDFKPVAVLDQTGVIGPRLASQPSLPYTFTDAPLDSLKSDSSVDLILVIGADAVTNADNISLYTRGSARMDVEMLLSRDLEAAIEDERLDAYGIENIKEILEEVKVGDLSLNTFSLDDNGNEEASDALSGFLGGLLMAFVLYMFIIIYGQMVMHSIIEEKNNRVLELIVTSIKPAQLMVGKLLGIGAVAMTQVLIWVGIILVAVTGVLPALATDSPALQSALASIGALDYLLPLMGYLILYMLGGFLLFASIYAAIGASVDNAQDASQLQTFAIVPVLVALVFATAVAENPDSTLALWLSMIPLTSPMTMMTRAASGVPFFEVVLSLVLLYASIVAVIWFTSRIYRVGIFMYGKKPTIKELIRWARQK